MVQDDIKLSQLKRIQIRSFVKGGNHGQYFQALGLKELILSITPNSIVSHLDYNNHIAREVKSQVISGHFPKYISMRYYWGKNFIFSKMSSANDLTIYGSDTIWMRDHPIAPNDLVFFGENDSSRRIAYAPSVASRSYNKDSKKISEYIQKFDWIGVRDKNTFDFVYNHTGVKSDYVIDPCFFISDKLFLKYARRPHLSIYSPDCNNILKCFLGAADGGKFRDLFSDVLKLGYYPRSMFLTSIFNQIEDPVKIIDKVAQSKLLLTSTFHGVMIALMTKTPFIAISSDILNSRLDSPILKTFSKKRLMSIDKLRIISKSEIKELFDPSDINTNEIKNYINSSKELITNNI
jgi:hypothetical protein